MSRQTQLHVFPQDVNELIAAFRNIEPLEAALQSGNAATPERLAFIPEKVMGETLVLWSTRFAPDLQRRYVPHAQPPYYRVDEQTERVFELSLSAQTIWQNQAALTQGRIYGVLQNKPAEFEVLCERIVRYIRRRWRKNPVSWMGGYLGPAASDWFERGGLLLPSYIPPVRSDWIQRLGEQRGIASENTT